jgi:eukaryotic-like serine/threonine-protein kinase
VSDAWLWERWDEVDALLELALDQPPAERDAFVARACDDDLDLLRMLRRLLEHSQGPDAPVGLPPALLRAALTDPEAPESEPVGALEGRSIGGYRLGRVLGVGGMATVYLGERTDGVFERLVAVKVLHRSFGVPDVAARFRQERQILASLSHHGIGQMIDGGVTDDGRSWLVMEYVDGVAIDRYAHEKRLDVEARIRLVLQAAEAVEYAHRHMVVHRDLKPSNVLVTEGGRVKLLDFGIAKLLRPDDQESTPGDAPSDRPLTRQENRFVTPEYAAPEQLLGAPVSAQTDVYGLSAMLYELLTGTRPYAGRGALSVLERVIAGAEPAAPSAAVGPSEAAPHGSLRRRLSGDLDAILLRGLRARPEERYASVAALREDLERHLSGRAVVARGDARLYRLRRFVRRHRLPVGIAASTFLVVAGSAVGLAVQRSALVDERNRTAAAAEFAAREAETARQVTGLIVDLFEAGDARADDDTLTIAKLLERGAARVDSGLAGQPAVRAELLDVLGRVYGNLGRHDRAAALLGHAVALRADTLPDRAGLAASLAALGDVRRDERGFDDAVVAYRRALDEAARTGDAAVAATARLGMAHAWLQADATDSAEMAFQSGLAMLGALPDPSERSSLDAMLGLAGLLRRRDDLDGAADLYRQVIDHQRRTPDGDAMAFATSLNNLAVTRRMQGAYEEAATLYGEALDTAVAVLGGGHPTTLMFAGNLATVWHAAGRHDLCLEVYRARVAAARTQWPEGHWQLASTLMELGAELMLNGSAEEAMEPLTQAVAMLETELEPGHSWTAVYRGWLGAAATLAGRQPLARASLDESVATLSGYEGLLQNRTVIAMLNALVASMEQRGLTAEAARYSALLEPATPSPASDAGH